MKHDMVVVVGVGGCYLGLVVVVVGVGGGCWGWWWLLVKVVVVVVKVMVAAAGTVAAGPAAAAATVQQQQFFLCFCLLLCFLQWHPHDGNIQILAYPGHWTHEQLVYLAPLQTCPQNNNGIVYTLAAMQQMCGHIPCCFLKSSFTCPHR